MNDKPDIAAEEEKWNGKSVSEWREMRQEELRNLSVEDCHAISNFIFHAQNGHSNLRRWLGRHAFHGTKFAYSDFRVPRWVFLDDDVLAWEMFRSFAKNRKSSIYLNDCISVPETPFGVLRNLLFADAGSAMRDMPSMFRKTKNPLKLIGLMSELFLEKRREIEKSICADSDILPLLIKEVMDWAAQKSKDGKLPVRRPEKTYADFLSLLLSSAKISENGNLESRFWDDVFREMSKPHDSMLVWDDLAKTLFSSGLSPLSCKGAEFQVHPNFRMMTMVFACLGTLVETPDDAYLDRRETPLLPSLVKSLVSGGALNFVGQDGLNMWHCVFAGCGSDSLVSVCPNASVREILSPLLKVPPRTFGFFEESWEEVDWMCDEMVKFVLSGNKRDSRGLMSLPLPPKVLSAVESFALSKRDAFATVKRTIVETV